MIASPSTSSARETARRGVPEFRQSEKTLAPDASMQKAPRRRPHCRVRYTRKFATDATNRNEDPWHSSSSYCSEPASSPIRI